MGTNDANTNITKTRKVLCHRPKEINAANTIFTQAPSSKPTSKKFPEQKKSTMWSCYECYWDQNQLAKWENPNQIIIQVNKLKMKAFSDAFDKGQMGY